MEVKYKDEDLEKFCHDYKKASKKLAGFANDLLAKMNFIEQANSFKDIRNYSPFNCHQLGKKKKDYEGLWSLDLKGRKTSWRIIVAPLDENENIFIPKDDFYSICDTIKIIRIEEVSNHYE